MLVQERPRLPGTLDGLLDAGTRLYRELADSDELLQGLLAVLAGVERAIGQDEVARLLLDVREALRTGESGRERLRATLRRYAPVR